LKPTSDIFISGKGSDIIAVKEGTSDKNPHVEGAYKPATGCGRPNSDLRAAALIYRSIYFGFADPADIDPGKFNEY